MKFNAILLALFLGVFGLVPKSFAVDTLEVFALRIQFQKENPDNSLTTGDGTFDSDKKNKDAYSLDPPENRGTPLYWLKHFEFANNYFNAVSGGNLVVKARVFPDPSTGSSVYTLAKPIIDYNRTSKKKGEKTAEYDEARSRDYLTFIYDAIAAAAADSSEEGPFRIPVSKNPNVKAALIEALSKAILEISSSSLTTISGLIALTMMQFRLGYDMGIVLTKGIVCSLITVFLLMPGLIMLFPRQLKKTAHRNLIPSIRLWGKFLTKAKYCFVWIFLILLPFAIFYSRQTEYAFSDTSITEIVYSPSREAMHKIRDTFADSNVIAVIVPSGEYENEKAILQNVSKMDHIRSATGLANIEVGDGHVLTDLYTPRMFSELLDIDYETALLLYQGYGIKHEEYQVFFGNADEYKVILLDMFEYLFEKIDQGMVSLDEEKTAQIQELRSELHRGTMQLRGENYDRLIFNADVPVEGDVSIALTDAISAEAQKYYGEGNVLVVGEITSARDLRDSYTGDSKKIALLTITFIFIILLFTFRTTAGAALLAFVIQGSIWINFTFPYFQGLVASFVTDMIVSAIQMGATIDYAIVIMNRYQSLKKEMGKREAMITAVDEGFATVITSGSILTMAGFMIGFRVSDVYVSHIGLAVGRGAAISVILVMTVLPQFILLMDPLIDKTSFVLRLTPAEDEKALPVPDGQESDMTAGAAGQAAEDAGEEKSRPEDAAQADEEEKRQPEGAAQADEEEKRQPEDRKEGQI